jgi:hypothetical protein
LKRLTFSATPSGALQRRWCVEPRSLTCYARRRRINDDVLNTMEQVWKNGGGVAEIPAARVSRCRLPCMDRHTLMRWTRRQDEPVPSVPSPSFTLHSNNVQQLCYGGKPSVRGGSRRAFRVFRPHRRGGAPAALFLCCVCRSGQSVAAVAQALTHVLRRTHAQASAT